MKTENILLLGGLALGAYLLMTKSVGADESNNNGTFGPGATDGNYVVPLPYASHNSTQGTDIAAYNETVKQFNQTPSIQAGLNVINAGFATGSLPRTSQTITKISSSTNVARLGDGSTKVITVNQPARDSSGMTNFDRIIAKNLAAKKK